MKIAVRLDDITPDMDWERFFQFKALLDRYQVKPLIGIVPDNQDENLKKQTKKSQIPEDFWSYIKELKADGWTLAMHGVHHIYTTDKGGLFPLNNFSEFAGIPLDKQKEMLSKGKQILKEKGIETKIFMAPAHSYDRNTLKALKEIGFTALTDGFGSHPYLWDGLKFYPISFNLSSTFKKKTGYSTMVVHTDTVTSNDLNRYESYFQNKNIQWISFKEYLEQPAKKRAAITKWNEFLMAKAKYLLIKSRTK
ncbi:MAG: DUF2334 domain-containing protein [Lachnospiraceae bacterium]|nr:DUF2334 domain-containing protein [Lachnospiraceae bacterium]